MSQARLPIWRILPWRGSSTSSTSPEASAWGSASHSRVLRCALACATRGKPPENGLQVAAGGPGIQRLLAGTQHQLAHVEAGHDGLAGAGVVGQHETQRLARQHGLVDRRDLVRQWLDQRGVNREDWIEKMG